MNLYRICLAAPLPKLTATNAIIKCNYKKLLATTLPQFFVSVEKRFIKKLSMVKPPQTIFQASHVISQLYIFFQHKTTIC